MDFNDIAQKTIHLVVEVGNFIRKEREGFESNTIISKGSNDFVTHVDKASEEHLVSGLSQILPGSGFIAEEGTIAYNNEEYNWIIDPIDGTTNFIHGAPPYSISIGLRKGETLIGGVIYELSADECFYAFDGGKAFLNGKEIQVSSTDKVANSLIATGFPYTEFGLKKNFMETLDYFFYHSHGVRRLGSAAADLAYVACGRYDAFYEYNLKAWDVAGGAYILQQAGGKLSDFKGGANFLFGKELIASNSLIFEEFSKIIGNIMKKEHA
ncbi:MAG TPA: inositol monophosphatase [Bacteroidales bacterium]|nr:inositol monophosphatase [Bacteroidales bacterium]